VQILACQKTVPRCLAQKMGHLLQLLECFEPEMAPSKPSQGAYGEFFDHLLAAPALARFLRFEDAQSIANCFTRERKPTTCLALWNCLLRINLKVVGRLLGLSRVAESVRGIHAHPFPEYLHAVLRSFSGNVRSKTFLNLSGRWFWTCNSRMKSAEHARL